MYWQSDYQTARTPTNGTSISPYTQYLAPVCLKLEVSLPLPAPTFTQSMSRSGGSGRNFGLPLGGSLLGINFVGPYSNLNLYELKSAIYSQEVEWSLR